MKQIWLTIFILMLSACGFSAGTIPADHFYRLSEPVRVNVTSDVVVKSVQADGIYNERAMLFVNKNQPLELARYSYHFWAQTPARLVQGYLQGCLNKSGEMSSLDKNKQIVELNPVIESFERVLENGQAEASVKIRVNQHVYEARLMADSMDMHATVVAYSQAMQQVCEAIARDI